MPRIDPLQLLKCLSVLLSPEGGILSRDEVPRLVNLMTKFSKKLVSKCVYILILKNTDTELVDMFMAEGGWTLIQTWLQDAVTSGNWDLVKEILELLLVTPVDVERLKMNCLPKLIKTLSRREDLEVVSQLSNKIVQNWLVIVKGSGQISNQTQVQPTEPSEKNEVPVSKPEVQPSNNTPEEASPQVSTPEEPTDKDDKENEVGEISAAKFYKLSLRDGKQVIKKIEDEEDETDNNEKVGKEQKSQDSSKKIDQKDKSSPSSKHKTSSKSSTSEDKDKKRSSSSKSSSSSKHSSSRDKSEKRDRDKDKDRHRSKSSSSSSSKKSSSSSDSKSKDRKDSKDKDHKEKQAEKDKDTLAKLKPQTLDKLGRIPKKSSDESSSDKSKENKKENKTSEKPKESSEAKKKPSFSILDRKTTGEERTKTVKVFNSKMRSTGLEEEVKPPPPRTGKKPTPSVILPTIPHKRPSPPKDIKDSSVPPEKKIKFDKVDVVEKPGAIKLIPPKPKPPVLQESDIFMDALTASATPKKDLKKRKRRPSVTKDAPSTPTTTSEGQTPTTQSSSNTSSPTIGLKNIAPINFYQDTLNETNESQENPEDAEDKDAEPLKENDAPKSPSTPVEEMDEETDVERTKTVDGLKGVLVYSKRKGPKRSIQWKADESLVEIRYFELDETERINVTKTFTDMAKMEMTSEREALIMSRKLNNEDTMEIQTLWRIPILCDQPELLAPPGCKSKEKDIQFAREKSVMQALYFDKRRIPDSPEEPDPENFQISDPIQIPLEDADSQEIDLRNTPWPEPKGSPPHPEPHQMPQIFQNIPQFNPAFNNVNMVPPQFQQGGVPPRFPMPSPNPMGPPGPGNFAAAPNMLPNSMMGMPPNMGPPQDMMPQGPMNPMFVQGAVPEGFMQQDKFAAPFNGPPNPNMNNMNMFPPNNFNNHRRGGFRRGGNNSGWVRMNSSGPQGGNWKRGGGGHRGGRMCKNVQNHGYCRNRDNCPFIHP